MGAVDKVTGLDGFTLGKVRFLRALVVPETETPMYVLLDPDPDAYEPEHDEHTGFTWAIVSLSPTGDGAWLRHADGEVGHTDLELERADLPSDVSGCRRREEDMGDARP